MSVFNRKVMGVALEYLSRKRHMKKLDLTNEEDVRGKIVIITGANSGIGKCTVEELAKRGAHVIMACRNLSQGQMALDDIKKRHPETDIVLFHLDLEDLESIRKFARELREVHGYTKIDILINNAGVYFSSLKERILSKEGFEIHFGVNHLGHFLLTNLLLDVVKNASPSRIIFVSSMSYALVASFDLDDLMLEKCKNKFGPGNLMPYANSKWANMLTARELSRRLEGTGVTTYALCPGYVSTNIFRHDPCHKRALEKFGLWMGGLSPEKGAETTLYCALSKEVRDETGQMYTLNCRWDKACKDLDKNEEVAKKLWKISEILTGIGPESVISDANRMELNPKDNSDLKQAEINE